METTEDVVKVVLVVVYKLLPNDLPIVPSLGKRRIQPQAKV